ncbi:uncharacterized protein ACA1_132380 [Acanthamoeba castellanii str. Neff]|uniref:Uncharacterized protein n=1 Tax=Acanthamoeba castellanii (strain ATCC 30010 / Neff) TaxID=1257118 RepID=L8GVI0_ACACF|nr:uncharacterized protein ACA1_132380 [Acanthamoeba castellanii str. Neff]ELR17025.1 hypothetical protein ACA1_132380 [Acanthamoeba castellanii str. Neff]
MPVFMPYIKRSPATAAFVGVTCGSKSAVLWGLAKGLPNAHLMLLLGEHGNMPIVLNFGSIT